MKQIVFPIFMVLILAVNSHAQNPIPEKPEPLPAIEFKFPDYKEVNLKNGLKVFVIEDHEQPVVSVQMLLPSGTSMDGNKAGLAHMTASLLTKGTKKYSAEEIAEKIDGLGSSIGANAQNDYIMVSFQSLTKHLPVVLEVFAEVVTKPKFPGKEFDKLIPKMMSAIQEMKSNPSTIAANLAKKVMFGDEHPYSKIFNEETIKSISNGDVEDFYEKFFMPNNATIAIVGDVNEKEIVKMIDKAFKEWKSGAKPKIEIPKPNPLPQGVYFVSRPASVQSSIIVGNLTVPYNSKDFDACNLAGSVIGAGFAGRLFRTLRETYSYTYTPFGYQTSNKFYNMFLCGADVRNSVTDSAITVINTQLGSLARTIAPEQELMRVKNSKIGGYLMSFEDAEFVASLVQTADLIGLPVERFKNYPKMLHEMPATSIMMAAKRYMSPENEYIFVVGSEEVKSKLEQFGKIYEYDMDLNPLSGDKAKMESVSMSSEDLIEKYVQAIGGKDAIAKIQSSVDTAKVEILLRSMTLKGKIIQLRKAPNKKYQFFDMSIQKQKIYVDGQKAWISSNDLLEEKKGKEFDDLLWDATLFNLMKTKELGFTTTVLGKQGNFILMKLSSTHGSESTYYFDANTYLPAKIEQIEETPQGPIPSTVEFLEYSTVEGVKFPKVMKSTNPMFSMTVTAETQLVNVQLDDAIFAPTK
ncbi:MAG: pitrilysin family protein [Bacteroidota bacterium]